MYLNVYKHFSLFTLTKSIFLANGYGTGYLIRFYYSKVKLNITSQQLKKSEMIYSKDVMHVITNTQILLKRNQNGKSLLRRPFFSKEKDLNNQMNNMHNIFSATKVS